MYDIPFTSDITFQIFEDKRGQKYVKITLNDQPMLIKGCKNELCPFEVLIS